MEFEEIFRMREPVISFAASVLLLGTLPACAKEEPTAVNDRLTAEAVIKGLYARKISDLEYPMGKAATSKTCTYIKSIFDSSLFAPDPTNLKCGHFERFPNIDDESLSLMDEAKLLPKTQIVESRIKGSEAVIKVKTPILDDSIRWKSWHPQTRVVYFMRKTDSGWKIFNMLSYENRWPLDMKSVEGPEVRGCQGVDSRYSFLVYPRGPEDLEDLPKPCQTYEIKERNRTKEWDK